MKLFFAFLVLLIEYSNSWEIFHNGRWQNGILRPPKYVKMSPSTKELYLVQKLDHFNPQEEVSWQQRYFVNEKYFVKGKQNVVFLMIGGEGEASALWMDWGAWVQTAKQHNALLFQLEHRFYGKSKPTKNYTTDSLRFLTSEQALADLALFITEMNKEYDLGENVRWIAFGGSYPGNLAAWLRQKYPHLVHGAMSASGPLLAKLDFEDYYRVVREDLLVKGGEECVDAVQSATKQLKAMLSSSDVKKLDQMFKLCSPISKSVDEPLDIATLFDDLAENFAGIAQYNEDNRSNGKNNFTLDTVCEIMTDTSIGTELERLAALNNKINEMNDISCTNYLYDELVKFYKQSDEDLGGGRQWLYQTCNEFGYYQTSSNKPQIFGDMFPLDYMIQQCIDIFGEQYNQTFIESAIKETNTNYGGLDIDVSNVVFVHGTIDPWHALGVLESKKNAPVILINGTAHCANMYEEADDDLPELKAARKQIDELVKQWLSQ